MQNDVLIVGTGIIGLAAALALARANFSVALIDSQPQVSLPLTKDYALRVSALTPNSIEFLQRLEVWETIVKQRIAPFYHMAIGEASPADFILNFDIDHFREKQLGVIVENFLIQQALNDALVHYPQVKIYQPKEITNIEVDVNERRIYLTDQQILRGKLLIGADGAASKIRQWVGITQFHKNYQEQAMVATIQTELPHQDTARQRFLKTGPIAMLPLADPYHCSLVWTNDIRRAAQLKQLSQTDFTIALQEAFGATLGNLQVMSERVSFPITLQQAHHYIEERLALIGDAAHVIHPLAGQGANLGLQDVVDLTDALIYAAHQKRDIGHRRTLRNYERRAKIRNYLMQSAVDKLRRIFQFSLPPAIFFRQAGLQSLENTAWLKQWIIRYAMGRKT